MEEQLSSFTESLTLLHRLGLGVIVVHGAGPQMNRHLKEIGMKPNISWSGETAGMRITDGPTLTEARKVFQVRYHSNFDI